MTHNGEVVDEKFYRPDPSLGFFLLRFEVSSNRTRNAKKTRQTSRKKTAPIQAIKMSVNLIIILGGAFQGDPVSCEE